MCYIAEIQGLGGERFAHLVTMAATRLEAEAEYHRILAAAALSALPTHAALIFDGEGVPVRHACYRHPESEREEIDYDV